MIVEVICPISVDFIKVLWVDKINMFDLFV